VCTPPLKDRELQRIVKGKQKFISDGKFKGISNLTFDSLADIASKNLDTKPCWVGEWLYPGAHLVVGRPKIGKSWVLLQLIKALATGKTFLGYETRLPKGDEILAVFAEDDDARIQARSKTFGKHPDNINVINRNTLLELATKYQGKGGFPEWLDQYLEANPQIRVVVLDTEEVTRQIWRDRVLPKTRNLSPMSADYEQTARFDTIALKHQVAILLVNHASKVHRKTGEHYDVHEIINRTNTALAGASGSIVIADLPDADRLDPSETRRLFGVRGRDVIDEVLCVIKRRENSPAYINEGDYHEVEHAQAMHTMLSELRAWMDNKDVPCTADGYYPMRDLAQEIGFSHIYVKKMVARMRSLKDSTWNGYRVATKSGIRGGIKLVKVK
jgi:hypothetical protein